MKIGNLLLAVFVQKDIQATSEMSLPIRVFFLEHIQATQETLRDMKVSDTQGVSPITGPSQPHDCPGP